MPSANPFLVGRQPIFDRNLKVVAYELLFRGSPGDSADIGVEDGDGDRATSKVLLHAFTDIGLDALAGKLPVYVNLTRNFCTGEIELPPLQQRVVIEVLEESGCDEALFAGVRRLAEAGFTIALDDFIYHPSLQPLVDIAHVVKIDALALDREALAEHVRLLRPHNVRLLAEKIEDDETLEYCRELGFDLFQGYFLCRPNYISGRRAGANRNNVMHLLVRLRDPELEIRDLESLIAHDLALTYRLLRYVNSPATGVRRKVDSIHGAIMLLGLDAVRNIANLVALSNIDDKPDELTTVSLVRARMCELLALRLRLPGGSAFAIGLCSTLDAFMDQPLEEIVADLPLHDDLIAALLHREGEYGAILRAVLDHERGDLDGVTTSLPQLDAGIVTECWLQAVAWARQIRSTLSKGPDG